MGLTEAAPAGAPPFFSSSWYPRYVLGVLTFLNIANLWHRYLLYNLSAVSASECTSVCSDVPFVPLCEPCDASTSVEEELTCIACQTCRLQHSSVDFNLKDGACINNVAYGYLAGFGFTVMFAFVGLFAGYCSDRLDRRLVHTTAVLVWSLAAAGHGTCSSFNCLLMARVLVGVGEAFNAPCCYAVIQHYFPPEQRATANGIYSTGTYVGAAASSLCILLASAVGWRATAFASGACGVVAAAVLFFTVKQPPRPVDQALPSLVAIVGKASANPGEEEKLGLKGGFKGGYAAEAPKPALGLVAAARALLTNPCAALLIIATSVRMIGVWVIASYVPLYYKRAFPSYTNAFSVFNAGFVSVGGIISSYGGGYLADRYASRCPGALAWVPAVGALLGLIPMAIALFSTSFYVSIFALFAEYAVAECWLGPGMSVLQREAPRAAAGFSVAVLLFCNTLVSNVGPLMIAAADPGTAAVRNPIFAQMALSYVLSAGLFTVLGFLLQGRAKREGSGTAMCVVEALRACPASCSKLGEVVTATDSVLRVATPQEMEELISRTFERPPAFEGVIARPVSPETEPAGGISWQLSI